MKTKNWKWLLVLPLLWTALETKAQEEGPINIRAEVRFDWQYDDVDGVQNAANSGFKGRYLNIALDGKISDKFNYAYRQRLNRAHSDEGFFDATDWLWLNYQPTKNWGISAGKQVVMIGGFEYDRNPTDVYFASEYWNNIACYQLGASVTYTTNAGNNKIMAQVCQSPFRKADTTHNLYAYNLFWTVSEGCYSGLHSLNASEYLHGDYIFYLALGNQFKWGDATLQIDYMERNTNVNNAFENFSVMGEFSYLIADRVNLFARATYDHCSEDFVPMADLCIFPGTELTRVGGGVEYYPLGGRGNRSIRLHAACSYTFGNNTNPAGTALDKQTFVDFGLTWRLDILNAIKQVFCSKKQCE